MTHFATCSPPFFLPCCPRSNDNCSLMKHSTINRNYKQSLYPTVGRPLHAQLASSTSASAAYRSPQPALLLLSLLLPPFLQLLAAPTTIFAIAVPSSPSCPTSSNKAFILQWDDRYTLSWRLVRRLVRHTGVHNLLCHHRRCSNHHFCNCCSIFTVVPYILQQSLYPTVGRPLHAQLASSTSASAAYRSPQLRFSLAIPTTAVVIISPSSPSKSTASPTQKPCHSCHHHCRHLSISTIKIYCISNAEASHYLQQCDDPYTFSRRLALYGA